MITGIKLITIERKRQVDEEGWTPEHDDQHDDESLALAACYYALPERYETVLINFFPDSWCSSWAKKGAGDRVRDLVKAGALIAAEIDRINKG